MSAAGLSALGTFLQSIGQSAPQIAMDYNAGWERQDAKRKAEAEKTAKKAAKASGYKKIQSSMQSLLEDAATHPEETLAKLDPKDVEQAQSLISQVPGAAKPGGAIPEFTPRTGQEESVPLADQLRQVIMDKESSGGQYRGAHPQAANGDVAHGRFGIVPKYHFEKIGMDPNNPEHVKKVFSDKAQEEELFSRIMDENLRLSGGDVEKALARHYGGNYGQKVVGTPEGDKPQKLADGRTMPSVNDYVRDGMARIEKNATVNDLKLQGKGVIETAESGRGAMRSIINEKPTKPKKHGRAEKTLLKLYTELTPEEVEENRHYLDYISDLASREGKEYERELAAHEKKLDRQVMVSVNAMKLDASLQSAMAKARTGKGNDLNDDQIRALNYYAKVLEGQRKTLMDFSNRVAMAKNSAREELMETRPDLTEIEEPGRVGKIFGREGKRKISTGKIENRLQYLDDELNTVNRALAGFGGLYLPPPEAGTRKAGGNMDLEGYLE